MTLYELTGQFLELVRMAEEKPFDQQIINDTLEGVEMEIEEKAVGYAKVIRSLEGDMDEVDEEIQRLTERRNTIKENIDALKKNLEKAMIATGKTKFKTPLFSFSIQKNAPSLDLVDEAKVPERFWIPQVPRLDRRALLAYAKEHDGQLPYATTKQTESLRIR